MLNMRASHGGLRMKEQHFIWSSSQPHRFSQHWSLTRCLQPLSQNYGFQFGSHFLYLYACMRT